MNKDLAKTLGVTLQEGEQISQETVDELSDMRGVEEDE